MSPCRRYLLATEDISPQTKADPGAGALHSYHIESSGDLTHISTQPTGGHGNSCVTFDRTGKFLLVTRYWDSGFSVLPFNEGIISPVCAAQQHQGSGPNTARQSVPHPHGVYGDPTADRVYVSDLGTDEVVQYNLDTGTGSLELLSAVHMGAESGPRGMIFHPQLPMAYVNCELGGTIVACKIDPACGLMPQQTLQVYPSDFQCDGHPQNLGRSTTYWASEATITPDGCFVYMIARVHQSIAIMKTDSDGSLMLVGRQKLVDNSNARNLSLDPTGRFLLVASQDANAVECYAVQSDGGLHRTDQQFAPCAADVAIVSSIQD